MAVEVEVLRLLRARVAMAVVVPQRTAGSVLREQTVWEAVVVQAAGPVLETEMVAQAAPASWCSGINCDHEDLHEVRREQAAGSVLSCASREGRARQPVHCLRKGSSSEVG
jgi:hypothetical protein